MNVDDIDWNDPIAANKLLREKLAMLEMQQGNHSSRPEHIDGGYDFDDEEYEGWRSRSNGHRDVPREQPAAQSLANEQIGRLTTGGAKKLIGETRRLSAAWPKFIHEQNEVRLWERLHVRRKLVVQELTARKNSQKLTGKTHVLRQDYAP